MKKLIAYCVLIALLLPVFVLSSCSKDEEKTQDTSLKDGDGNTYTTVTIGTQVWMKENLRATKYLNGDLIGTSSPATLDLNGESTPKYQWTYEANESNAVVYGRLYTWYVAMDSRKVCPAGWHVPTDADWTVLSTFLGGEAGAGGKLKEVGTSHWLTPNTGATNETGFTAVPGGTRSMFGTFEGLGTVSTIWSSTEKTPIHGYVRSLVSGNTEITGFAPLNKSDAAAIRCLKD